MSWRSSLEIGFSEHAVGSRVPASGAGGLALGAWVLRQGGMPVDQIARRSVAFFLIKSSVNFVAVAALGALMATGLIGPHRSLWLTAAPAAATAAAVLAYRVILFWLPLLVGGLAFASLRRGLNQPHRPDLCPA